MQILSHGIFARAIALMFFLCTQALAADPSANATSSATETRLKAAIEGFPGTVSLYARNLDSGAQVNLAGDQRVRTASTIKLPIACALAAEVAAGRARWDERLTLRKQDKVSGSGVLAEFGDGETVSLRDAMVLMIVVSDNTATNLILDRIGADAVNGYLISQGFIATRSMRKIRGDGTQLKPAEGWSREGESRKTSATVSARLLRARWFGCSNSSNRGGWSIRKFHANCSGCSNVSSTRTVSVETRANCAWRANRAASMRYGAMSESCIHPRAVSPSRSPSMTCPSSTIRPTTPAID